MTQEIIAGNKMIAILYNGEENVTEDAVWMLLPDYPMSKMKRWIPVYDLKYHCSWSWLMPVCYKWDNLFTNKEVSQSILSDYQDYCDKLDNVIIIYEILPLFEQLVENIKWYFKKIKTLNY